MAVKKKTVTDKKSILQAIELKILHALAKYKSHFKKDDFKGKIKKAGKLFAKDVYKDVKKKGTKTATKKPSAVKK